MPARNARSWSAAASSGLTVLTGRAARLMSRPPSFATRNYSSQMADEVSWLAARTQHPLELLASQMRRAVAEAAKP
jgi:hypothetical protein